MREPGGSIRDISDKLQVEPSIVGEQERTDLLKEHARVLYEIEKCS